MLKLPSSRSLGHTKRRVTDAPGFLPLAKASCMIAALLCCATVATARTVCLNELVAIDGKVADFDGEFHDWIELFNTTDTAIDLSGFELSDDRVGSNRWTIPEGHVLEAGAFLLIFASGKDRAYGPELHTDFRLDSVGERLLLFDNRGEPIDLVEFPEQRSGWSYCRRDSAGVEETWAFSPSPTAAAENSGPYFSELPAEKPTITPPGGFFPEGTLVKISMNPGNLVIRMTTDGSEPSADSPPVDQSVRIQTTSMLRVAAFVDDTRVTRVATATFIVETEHEIDVLSLVAEPDDLFGDERGIYTNPEGRGREWERPVSVELLSRKSSPGFKIDAGVRIHGNTTRASPKKSLRLYFRSEYGTAKLEHKVFEEPESATKFDNLVLFMGTELTTAIPVEDITYVRRILLQPLFKSLGQITLHYRPVALYLNGEYWGLYFIIERADANFARAYLGGESWDVIEGLSSSANVVDGDRVEWNRFLDALHADEFSGSDGLERLRSEVDAENVTAYFLLFSWGIFRDIGLNLRSARERNPEGRWRFIPWDASAFRESDSALESDMIGGLLRNRFSDFVSLLFSALMNHEEYVDQFYAALRSTTAGELSPHSYRATVEKLRREIASEIPRESLRWGFLTEAEWHQNMDRIAAFGDWRSVSLPLSSAKWFPPLSCSRPSPPPLPSGTRIAVIHDTASGPSANDAALVARLESRGASVSTVAADDALPDALSAVFDLAIIGSGVAPEAFQSDYVGSTLPLVFSEGDLLADGIRLAVRRGSAVFDSIQLTEKASGITAGLPLWGLRYLQSAERVGVPIGNLGDGVRSLVTELRPGVGRTSNRPILLADQGAKVIDGRSLQARAAYVAVNDYETLDGYGWELFDRVVSWAVSHDSGGSDFTFLRGDGNSDGVVTMDDALYILRYLFQRAPRPSCLDAVDSNDDSRINVSDAIVILQHLFLGAQLPAPFPVAGKDPTTDSLPCDTTGIPTDRAG